MSTLTVYRTRSSRYVIHSIAENHHQLGVLVKGGAVTAVHAVHKFITNNIDSDDPKVIVKPDMMNALNSV